MQSKNNNQSITKKPKSKQKQIRLSQPMQSENPQSDPLVPITPSLSISLSVPSSSSHPIHLAPSDKVDTRKVIVILEKANLQTAILKRDKTHTLLNGDQHGDFIRKRLHRDPGEFRPDITHQSLLTLLDSPLNKAGKLEVFLTTESNQVIRINPLTRIPRTYKRFAPLMAQLLKKMTIRAQQTNQVLMKIIPSPVTDHLPPQSLKIAFSTKGKLINIFNFVRQLYPSSPSSSSSPPIPTRPLVFLIGAVAHGNPTMQVPYYDEAYCISRYAMSASNCLARLVTAFQDVWGII